MRLLLVTFILALAAAGLIIGYQGCAPDALAVLTQKQAQVSRDHADQLEEWQHAELGAEFFVGDGIKTGTAAQAVLALEDDNRLRVESETTIRFAERPPEAHSAAIDLQMGNVTLEAGNEGFTIQTALGLARLEANGKLVISQDGDGLRYEVMLGSARLETVDGPVELAAGESVRIGIGNAIMEEPDHESPDAATDAAAEASPTTSEGPISANVSGHGARIREAGSPEWRELADGEQSLAGGTDLHVRKGTTVAVQRGKERASLHGTGEYRLGESGTPLVQAKYGRVALESGTAETVQVPGGLIVADPASKADITVSAKNGTEVEVSTGAVTLETAREKQRVLAGQTGKIGKDGELAVAGRGPGYSELSLPVSSSIIIHTPDPPTAVAFRFGKHCKEGGVVELLRHGRRKAFSRGEGMANLLVPRGRFRYQLRCLTEEGITEQPAAKGWVTVIHDSGTAAVPRSAPSTRVDTDGRRYTIMYQNLLPTITVRWPEAPASVSSYSVTATSAYGRSKTVSTSQPHHTFRSGQLAEGTHTLVFKGGGKRSKSTTAVIRFDNAAPKVSLKSPTDGSFNPGSTVTVSGIALSGWTVTVGGKELPQDAAHRFSGEVTVPANARALAVQLSHPHKGVHHYLRRVQGSP